MPEVDEWGKDPQVRYLRRVFAHMEIAQKGFLERLNISPFDERLLRMRESALKLFENAWMVATRKGITVNEDELGILYLHCLARLFQSRDIEIPPGTLPRNEKITALLKEAGS